MARTDKGSRQFEDLVKIVVQNGVSVVAVEVESDTVVGVAVNRIQVINLHSYDPKSCHIFLDPYIKLYPLGL
jgi:hypothetical protein